VWQNVGQRSTEDMTASSLAILLPVQLTGMQRYSAVHVCVSVCVVSVCVGLCVCANGRLGDRSGVLDSRIIGPT